MTDGSRMPPNFMAQSDVKLRKNSVYNTNDAEGRFFSDRYYLNSDGPIDEHYYETIGELAEVISEIVGHPVGENFEECENALEVHMEENPEEWYSLHEFTVCDD